MSSRPTNNTRYTWRNRLENRLSFRRERGVFALQFAEVYSLLEKVEAVAAGMTEPFGVAMV